MATTEALLPVEEHKEFPGEVCCTKIFITVLPYTDLKNYVMEN